MSLGIVPRRFRRHVLPLPPQRRVFFLHLVLQLPLRSDEAQTTALAQFRKELSEEGMIPADLEAAKTAIGYDRYDDKTLLRFLRARKFDLPKSKLMWENNEKWRKDFGTDEIAK